MLVLFTFVFLTAQASVSFGPLLKELAPFEIDHHLPTFPVPFTLPLSPNQKDTKYIYFPGEDSAADRDASIMRCRALEGELYDSSGDAVEREMIACVIGDVIHVNRRGKSSGADCWVMLPGGAMANSADYCKRPYGSVCKLNQSH